MKNKGTLLAQNLKKLRKMNNYSMSTVADKLELSSHGVYANWEYGRNEPNVAITYLLMNWSVIKLKKGNQKSWRILTLK